jgi:hexosaminidase
MKRKLNFRTDKGLLLALLLCCTNALATITPAIIPAPSNLVAQEGSYTLTSEARVFSARQLPGASDSVRLLLGPATGFNFEDVDNAASAQIKIVHRADLAAESYELQVGHSRVQIYASGDAGVFYALQTLRQLLPKSIYSEKPIAQEWVIPAVTVTDSPRFGWRGMHLDVGRHFMPVKFVKKFIDLMAVHKFNSFHWHLTEDQGWRIEIKQFPRLTRIGSKRAQTVLGNPLFKEPGQLEYDGTPHEGFYTQEQIKDVVAYAAARYINVVPEIEFPGHAQAAIAAYPELGNTGDQLIVKEEWGISKNTLKPSQETIAFYRKVLFEVLDLFPSEYIHIGGDEAPKEQWQESSFAQQRIEELGLEDEHELQSWLIQQMDDLLASRGRKLIGWDEIMQGGLSSNATVMSWRGTKPGIEAAEAGHDVIMAPTRYTYFDYYQADKANEPMAIGFYLSLQDVYRFDPAPKQLPAAVRQHILGAQGQLWTEYMHNGEHVEYMAYPRAVALSEVVWSAQENREYADFQRRLPKHLERLDVLGVNYRPTGNDELTLVGKIEQSFWNVVIDAYFWFSDL